jgi:hypothetical protein
MRKGAVNTGFWCGNIREGYHLEDSGVDGRIILKMDLREVTCGQGLDRCGSEERKVAGCCECGNEPSGSTKCGEFLE